MTEHEHEREFEHDDYLWDRTGTPDPEVERLERTLGALRYRGAAGAPASAPASAPAPSAAPAPAWRGRPALGLAALVALAALATWSMWPAPGPAAASWDVRALQGTVRIDDRSAGTTASLGLDQWLDTSGGDQVLLDVADIGTVTVHPGTRLRIAQSKAGVEHRLELARGRIEAFITAPPRLFFVDTPAASAVDLGCAYELAIDPGGRGGLVVTMGLVSLERDRLVSTVPADGECLVRPGVGPGTPFFGDAAEAFRRALEAFDFDGGGAAALAMVLEHARKRDALSLWHLLGRTDGADRAAVCDRLASLSPPPAGVSHDALLRGDPAALEDWWDDLSAAWPFMGARSSAP